MPHLSEIVSVGVEPVSPAQLTFSTNIKSLMIVPSVVGG